MPPARPSFHGAALLVQRVECVFASVEASVELIHEEVPLDRGPGKG
jgi:hypothetical protein